MVCRRCGYANPEQNRYCGMCGIRLETLPEPVEKASPPEKETQASKRETAFGGSPSRPSVSVLGLGSEPPPAPPRPRPAITGPSFLGLGAEPEGGTSYLLDEEQPRSHRGLWIALMLLLAAVLVGMQFKSEVRLMAGQLYAAALGRVNPPSVAPPAPSPAPADSTAPGPQASSPPAASVGDVQPATGVTSPLKPDDNGIPAANETSTEATQPGPDATEGSQGEKTTQKAKYARASRPSMASTEAVAPENSPLLQLAQKYIRGQGVRQDCTTGLAYLREAMKRPNAAAASQMGALYATGTCVTLDRLSAYRYFSSAMQMAPNNPWLARERDELYAQMSSAERRQADRQ